MPSLRRNLICIYFIRIFDWFLVLMPVIVPFFYSNKLTLQDVLLLQSVYSISIVALEIPSGYVADVWGRRSSMILGTILTFVGLLIFSFSFSFIGFLVAQLLMGIGQSFVSGTDSALLYDALVYAQKEDEYLKLESRMTSFSNFSESFAGILGGFLSVVCIRYPLYAQTVIAALSIPFALLIQEPKRSKNTKKPGIKDIFLVVKETLHTNKELRNMVMLSSILGASTLMLAWLVQPYFEHIKIPLALFGIIWTALNFTVGIFSWLAYKFDKWFGLNRLILLIVFVLYSAYFLMGLINSWLVVIFLFFAYMARGIITPTLKDYINKLTSSEVRATVLSVRNFIIRLSFSILAIFIGFISKSSNSQTAILVSGVILVMLCLPFIYLAFYRKS